MTQNLLIEEISSEQMRNDIPKFNVGDTVKVHCKIIEGKKERVQVITGTVVAKKGSGLSETFTLYRIAYGAAMERDFPLHSPRIVKIEVQMKGKVRRAKLGYIRGVFGKKAKIKEQLGVRKPKKKAPVAPKSTQEDSSSEEDKA